MKKLFLIAALVAVVSQAQAQGCFNFSNSGAPIYIDRIGGPLAGITYHADYVYARGTVTDPTKLTIEPIPQGVALNASGVFFGGQQILNNYVGVISVQVRVWAVADGATYDQAAAAGGCVGYSNIIQIDCPDITAVPSPTVPNMVGLGPFVATVPEPGTIALGVMGVAALLFRRRK